MNKLDMDFHTRRVLRRIADAGSQGITTEELGVADSYIVGLLFFHNFTTTEMRPTSSHLIRVTALGREALAEVKEETK